MTASHTTTDDARIPDHCGWAARGYWREAYDDAVAALRRVTAERDEWQAACSTVSASLAIKVTHVEAEVARVTAERDEWQSASTAHHPNPADHSYWEGRYRDEKARAEAAEHQLKTVLDREAATTARYDAKMETAEAEVARLKAQAREDAMQLLATSGQAQDALAEVATLRAELDDAKSENASRSAMFATVSAELDAARGRVKPLVWTQLAITKEHKGLSGVWLCAWGINGQYEVHVFDTDPTHVMLNGPDIVPTAIYTTIEAAKAAAQADYTARILATLEPDPAVARMREPDSDWGDFIWSALNEAEKAMRKFPQPNYVISKIAEEAGEVVKAAIHCAEGRETTENVRGEMKQLVAMLYRLWVEGDQVHGMLAARTSGTGEG